jgi:UDP-GlcNAc:undecaprenyl-phosphate/decaprenyl-phosphate GlcNAc-1-phosphate transferase
MKVGWVSVLALALLVGPAYAQQTPEFKTQKDKIMYSLGVNFVSNLRQQGMEIDLDLVTRGMRDAFAGGQLLLSDEDIRIAIQKYQIELRQKQGQILAKTAAENKRAGEAFLAANKSAEGVVVLPSGLQYKVLKAGSGKKPTDADTVAVEFRGTFVNGAEFDGSHRTGKPASLTVGAAIPGWKEALKLMPVGSTWVLYVPAPLAYGERGKAGSVGPNAALVYELELLAIK